MSAQDQRIQIAHAVLKMALAYHPAEADYRIVELDGGESKKAFDRTIRKMPERGVAFVVYEDSDRPEWGYTAIATIPVSGRPLPHKLRRNSPGAECVRTAGFNANGGAKFVNLPIGQPGSNSIGVEDECLRSSEKEHSTFSREVAG